MIGRTRDETSGAEPQNLAFELLRVVPFTICRPLLVGPVKPGDDSYAVIANRPTDLPGGQISELAVQLHLQKYFPSRLTQIKSISIDVPSHTEGRLEIVTDARRDAVDAEGCL
jgi:hypothetical protein